MAFRAAVINVFGNFGAVLGIIVDKVVFRQEPIQKSGDCQEGDIESVFESFKHRWCG